MNQTLIAAFNRYQRIALIVGLVGLVLCVIGLFFDSAHVMQSYLFAFVYWTGIALGCLALVMIQFTVKGTWGLAIRRLAEAGALTLPLMAILFIPILIGIGSLYPWAQSSVLMSDVSLQQKSAYLNLPFFIVRAVIFFALWSSLAYTLRLWSNREEPFQRLQNLSIVGVIVLSLTVTFAMIDWVMSLEPDWSSTIYAVMVAMGGLLAAFALIVALLTRLRDYEPLSGLVTPAILNDLGNLLMAALLMWAYMAFSQFLVIWSGNLRDEIPWYVRRLDGGWQVVAMIIVIAHFAIPFVLLLSPQIKRHAGSLGAVAGLLVVMHVVDVFWLVLPALRSSGFFLNWTDIVASIGIGGLWIAAFLWQLKQSPLLPRTSDAHVIQEAHANG